MNVSLQFRALEVLLQSYFASSTPPYKRALLRLRIVRPSQCVLILRQGRQNVERPTPGRGARLLVR